tara:strand:+ start:99 stop:482 length:384 start_codon:yes stop_codon:yes gene_type:complete
MSSLKDRKQQAKQEMQDYKVKKNARIISVLFWFASSLYLYSTDVGFADVYSWKPFVFFILGPIFSAIVFGNIIFYSQRLIEKLYIKILASSKPQLIPVFVIVTFFSFLVALFLIIFEFAKAILAIIN